MPVAPPWLAPALLGLALLLVAVAAYAYVGYPLLVRLLPARARGGVASTPRSELPSVSVLVAARNEAPVIRERIDNLLAQSYPPDRLEVLVVSDASDDATDAIVAAIDDPRVRLVRQPRRRGKTAGINRLGEMARGEIIVQTDANAMFAPGCVAELARAFVDPRVGVAIGEVRFINADEPSVAAGEGLYWRFETWTKRNEAARDMLCTANGAVYAVRRGLWRALPEEIAGDAAEPLLAARAGYRTVVVPGARAFERAAGGPVEELRRKVRIIAQQVACARWIGLASLPRRIRFAYVSHKLLRYAVPFLLAGALLAALGAGALGSVAGWVVAALIVAPLVVAPLGLLPLPGIAGRAARLALYFAMLLVASVRGVLRGLAGRAPAVWEIPHSTRAPAGPRRGR
ncbi:MAG: glycosyltransferase family 2 protein [Acidobacteria bacterium]|nr:MAG: glycosyltransferase family 2 protein [Acidobacteriota bacterium]